MRTVRRYRSSIGTRDGSIIATVIASHMPRNDAAARGQISPEVGTGRIGMVSPGAISCIVEIEPHQWIVATVLSAKTKAQTPKKGPSEDLFEVTHASLQRVAAP